MPLPMRASITTPTAKPRRILRFSNQVTTGLSTTAASSTTVKRVSTSARARTRTTARPRPTTRNRKRRKSSYDNGRGRCGERDDNSDDEVIGKLVAAIYMLLREKAEITLHSK